MSEWYGESCGLDWGEPVSGTVPADAYDLYYHFDGVSVTTVAGNSFTIGSYYTGWFLEETDVAVVSWVLELGAATAGTFHLHSGLDPDWNYSAAVCTEDLGEHTVSGGQTFVSPPTSITTADLLAEMEEPTLLFEQIAGSSQIIQVKMRVWPVGGPRGAWTEAPEPTTTYAFAAVYKRLGDGYITGNGGMTTAELVWDEHGYDDASAISQGRAQTDLASENGSAREWQYAGETIASSQSSTNTTPYFNTGTLAHGYRGSTQISDAPGLLWAHPENHVSPVLPDSSGYDPREIYDEDNNTSWVTTLDGSPVVGQFAGWTGDLLFSYTGFWSSRFPDEMIYPTAPAVLAQSPGSESDVGAWTGARWQGTYRFVVGGAQTAISSGTPDIYGQYWHPTPIPIFGGEMVWLTARPPGITNVAVPDPDFYPFAILDGNTGTNMYDYAVHAQAGVKAGPNGLRYNISFEPLLYFEPALDWEEAEEPFLGSSSADTGEYVYEGDVGTGVAPPILWFVYQKWGFLGQHFVAYGEGLGDNQPELNGKFYLGPGTITAYPSLGDSQPTLVEWAFYPAGPNAYDGSQVMFPGTSVAPPVVDVEHQIIEFIVPTSITLTEPTEFHIYVINDNGMSNALSLMLYPMIDLDMESGEPILMTITAGMGEHGLDLPAEGPTLMLASVGDPIPTLEQRYSLIEFPYALTGRVPERAPIYLTSAEPAFELTGGAPSTGLDDPVNVALPMALRYRPLDSKITARPDLGTGMSVWDSNESSSMDWKFNVASAPYVDADNVISSRNGELVRPAMVFPGDAWAETTASFAAGPRLTVLMAVTIYPDPQPRSFILSSFISGAPDPDTFPFGVYIEGDQVSFVVGTKHQVVRIASGYLGQRPVIIGVSMSAEAMRMAVVSDKASIVQVTHLPLTASGFRLYLGRNNDAGNLQMATMDVLDLGVDHVTPAGPDRFWSIINRLDGIYGVMK
ncbi:MAG TPA: hypothetical protein VIT65_22335 [Microlunatus sp.]